MKNAFINAAGVLTCSGFIEASGTDTAVPVEEDFNLTPGQWQYTGGTWNSYMAPITAAQSAAAALLAGLTVTSTGMPSIDGTYACDALSQADIVAIETSLNAGKGFPGGATTFSYPDVTGALHAFSEANFTDFAAAVRDFVYACKSVIAGQSTTLPAATATIA